MGLMFFVFARMVFTEILFCQVFGFSTMGKEAFFTHKWQ